MTPKSIAKKSGITSSDVINRIKSSYPKYSKIVNSMANNPSQYGVRLLHEAELLARGEEKNMHKKEKKPRIYVSSELREKLKCMADEKGMSVEDLLKELVSDNGL